MYDPPQRCSAGLALASPFTGRRLVLHIHPPRTPRLLLPRSQDPTRLLRTFLGSSQGPAEVPLLAAAPGSPVNTPSSPPQRPWWSGEQLGPRSLRTQLVQANTSLVFKEPLHLHPSALGSRPHPQICSRLWYLCHQ